MSIDEERQADTGRGDHGGLEKPEILNINALEPVASFESPFDFPTWRKWLMTSLMGGMAAAITFGSSVWSSTIPVTTKQFEVGESVAVLGVSLYVLGFAIGPIVWGMSPACFLWLPHLCFARLHGLLINICIIQGLSLSSKAAGYLCSQASSYGRCCRSQ